MSGRLKDHPVPMVTDARDRLAFMAERQRQLSEAAEVAKRLAQPAKPPEVLRYYNLAAYWQAQQASHSAAAKARWESWYGFPG